MAVTDDYKFAEKTTVSAMQSMADLDKMLTRFGGKGFFQYRDPGGVYSAVGFTLPGGNAYMIYFQMPDAKKFSIDVAPARVEQRKVFSNVYDMEYARILRVILALVKMKLVAASEGVTTMEKEFFSDLVVWNAEGRQQTVYEWYAPQVETLRGQGLMPPVLPAIAEPKRMLQLYPREAK